MPLKNGDIANNTTFLHILTTSRKCNYNVTLGVDVFGHGIYKPKYSNFVTGLYGAGITVSSCCSMPCAVSYLEFSFWYVYCYCI